MAKSESFPTHNAALNPLGVADAAGSPTKGMRPGVSSPSSASKNPINPPDAAGAALSTGAIQAGKKGAIPAPKGTPRAR